MIRPLAILTLSLAAPAGLAQPVSPAGTEALEACRAAFPGPPDRVDRYAFVEADDPDRTTWYRIADGDDGWTSADGEVVEQLELHLFAGALEQNRIRLKQSDPRILLKHLNLDQNSFSD